MRFLRGLLLLMWCSAMPLHAQEVITYEFVTANGGTDRAEAVLRKPAGTPNRRAVVILHHGGGWGAGTTRQYADLFASHGFVTLEPRMFRTHEERRDGAQHLAETMGALRYLATLPDVDKHHVYAMGLSYGTFMAGYAGTRWATDRFTNGELRYAKIALLYPVCWMLEAFTRQQWGRWQHRLFPPDMLTEWVHSPMRVLAARDDDYNDRDPQACQKFVDAIPDERQRSLSSVTVYPATHGWDQSSASFYEQIACKGRGCRNTNTANPQVTDKAKEDLLTFFLE